MMKGENEMNENLDNMTLVAKVPFKVDPIFAIRTLCNIQYEKNFMTEESKSVATTSVLYKMSDEEYEKLVYQYCKERGITTVDIDEDFCSKFLDYIMGVVRKTDEYFEVLVSVSSSCIYDKTTKTFMEADFGDHSKILMNYLKDNFKIEREEEKEYIYKYCKHSIIIKGGFLENDDKFFKDSIRLAYLGI